VNVRVVRSAISGHERETAQYSVVDGEIVLEVERDTSEDCVELYSQIAMMLEELKRDQHIPCGR
jgi:hypothetical protein